jgi:hypothetical protein
MALNNTKMRVLFAPSILRNCSRTVCTVDIYNVILVRLFLAGRESRTMAWQHYVGAQRTGRPPHPQQLEPSTEQEPTSSTQQPLPPEKSTTMSKVVRSVKNVTKGYTTPQVKVRNGKKLNHLRAQPGEGLADLKDSDK